MPTKIPAELKNAISDEIARTMGLGPGRGAAARGLLLREIVKEFREAVIPLGSMQPDVLAEGESLKVLGDAAAAHFQRAQRVADGLVSDLDPDQYSDHRGRMYSAKDAGRA